MTRPTVEVLHVPECPNLVHMLDLLQEVLDLPVATREVTTEAEASSLGMTGSPTLLINGTDPFGPAGGVETGLSCRLYRDEHDRIVPVPSVDRLRAALADAETDNGS